MSLSRASYVIFFFFNDPATTEIYTLSLHDALPIYRRGGHRRAGGVDGLDGVRDGRACLEGDGLPGEGEDRKSTRLNSSHANISYAVFCLKKKKQIITFNIQHITMMTSRSTYSTHSI